MNFWKKLPKSVLFANSKLSSGYEECLKKFFQKLFVKSSSERLKISEKSIFFCFRNVYTFFVNISSNFAFHERLDPVSNRRHFSKSGNTFFIKLLCVFIVQWLLVSLKNMSLLEHFGRKFSSYPAGQWSSCFRTSASS